MERLLIAERKFSVGLGRTGRYFAYQQFSSKPDIAVRSQTHWPLAFPLGAILTLQRRRCAGARQDCMANHFRRWPMICAVALEFLEIVEDEKLFF